MVISLRTILFIVAVLSLSNCHRSTVDYVVGNRLDVKLFGAKGDGKVDDTKVLQRAISLAAGKYEVYIPEGDYLVDASVGLQIPSRTNIIWEEKAIFRCIPNNLSAYRIINIAGTKARPVVDVKLVNPTVIGDRNNHRGTVGEHGHGIVLSGAINVRIFNPKILDCWGDGLAIYGAEDVEIYDLLADNNRRQGITITKGRDIYIENPVCINTNGTPPASGIDIEPNYARDFLSNIKVVNPITRDNEGAGITVGCKKLENSTSVVTVEVINHIDEGSAHGFQIAGLAEGRKGELTGFFKNTNGHYSNNKYNGILVRGYAANNSPKIVIDSPTIINPNAVGQNSPRWGSGIAVIREKSNLGSTAIGNITITDASIEDNRPTPLMRRGIYAIDDKQNILEKFSIINPKKIAGVNVREMIDLNINNGKIVDVNEVTSLNATAGKTKLLSRAYARITNNNARELTVFDLSIKRQYDSTITFVNRSQHGMRLVPSPGVKILPLSVKGGNYIETFEVDATVTLRRADKYTWKIEKPQGLWTNQK